MVYYAAELIGAFIGAILAWLAFKEHFDAEEDPGKKLGVFSTGPAIRNYGWNIVTEVLGTFVLIFVILVSGGTPSGLGPLFVALVVVGIGASLGGPTGYAINPARDLGPRIAHAILPIKGKGGSDWSYAWVPIVGPLIGGALGALASWLSADTASSRRRLVRTARRPVGRVSGPPCTAPVAPSRDRAAAVLCGRSRNPMSKSSKDAVTQQVHCQRCSDERDVSADE